MNKITLVLGGARSGKSHYAEKLAIKSGLPVTYIATAQVYDEEFKQRVALHQQSRPAHWKTLETPHQLAPSLFEQANANTCVVVDCLTLWLAQCICPECVPAQHVSDTEKFWQDARQVFLAALPNIQGSIILVSNEVGMGIVPLGAINRQFQDEQGRLNQAVAQLAHEVVFVAAGLPLKLKG
ncbi:MAG: bifunctional adenosylcobinamide kinase/adenosylcobinamide-phosphate guanylyltransferase [Pseudomonadota bacterium]